MATANAGPLLLDCILDLSSLGSKVKVQLKAEGPTVGCPIKSLLSYYHLYHINSSFVYLVSYPNHSVH